MRRAFLVSLLAGSLLAAAPHAVLAANQNHASCIGVGASGVAPGTKDDIAEFINVLAVSTGTTHGALVEEFAQQKGACVVLPPVPPHP